MNENEVEILFQLLMYLNRISQWSFLWIDSSNLFSLCWKISNITTKTTWCHTIDGHTIRLFLQLFSCEWDSPRQQMLHSSYFHKTQSLRFHTKKVNIVTGISGAVESCPDHWHQMCLPVKWFCHSKTQRHLLQLQMDRFHWNKLLLNHLKSSLSWILRAFPDLSVI